MEERKKTAREIIEGYQGPPVRIMEVCGTPVSYTHLTLPTTERV